VAGASQLCLNHKNEAVVLVHVHERRSVRLATVSKCKRLIGLEARACFIKLDNPMRFFLKTDLKTLGMMGLLFLLSGCMFAPGMRMDQQYAFAPADAAVVPVLKSITPQLLLTEKTMREQQWSQDISQLLAAPKPYLIGVGDILFIVVWDHPEVSTPVIAGEAIAAAYGSNYDSTQGFVVEQDGVVQFPYVGKLLLSGLTELQARQKLTDKLARYFKNPQLTVRVQSFRSQRIYLDGEIKTPGIEVVNDLPMTLPEALSRAGGFLSSSDQSQIEINRAGTVYRVNLPELMQKGVDPSTIFLTGGDIVRVHSREESKIFVLGEVTAPSALLMHNGRLTLNEALGSAGGLNQLSSEGGHVYVVRNAADMTPIVYRLDAHSPVALALAENFELKAKDVVYVDPSPLTNWSRVSNLILPGAQALQSATTSPLSSPFK